MAVPYIIMINPKTFELVQMFRASNGRDYRMGPFGQPETCIGSAYTAERMDLCDWTLMRIHSPGDCQGLRADLAGINDDYQGKGYGLLLYAGVAAGVMIYDAHAVGVFSAVGARSRDAETLWKSMLKHKLANSCTDTYETDGDNRREKQEEHCFSIRDRDRDLDDGGYVTSSEVCGEVDVEYRDNEAEITYIHGDDVLEQDFVVWAAKEKADAPPPDMMTRVKLTGDPRETAIKIIRFMRERYDESFVEAFMGRADVAEALGQMRLFSGPSRPRGLPPLSARSRKLIDLFNKVED